jgi:hypothetical protein
MSVLCWVIAANLRSALDLMGAVMLIFPRWFSMMRRSQQGMMFNVLQMSVTWPLMGLRSCQDKTTGAVARYGRLVPCLLFGLGHGGQC